MHTMKNVMVATGNAAPSNISTEVSSRASSKVVAQIECINLKSGEKVLVSMNQVLHAPDVEKSFVASPSLLDDSCNIKLTNAKCMVKIKIWVFRMSKRARKRYCVSLRKANLKEIKI